MQIRTYDSKVEKKIIEGMIVSDNFCKVFINELADPSLFQIPMSKTVFKWCKDYWESFKESPKHTIQSIFESEGKLLTQGLEEAIRSFLEELSSHSEAEYDWKYWISQAEEHMQIRKLENLKEKISAAISTRKLLEIENEIGKWNQIKRIESNGIDIIKDREKMESILMDESQKIFTPRGKLGELLGDMHIGDFWAFVAPEKRGKTNWLIEFGKQAFYQGCKVVYFDFEMGYRKSLTRFCQNIMGLPIKEKYKTVIIPYLEYEIIKYRNESRELFNPRKDLKSLKKLIELSGGGCLKIVSLPAKSTSLKDIGNILNVWENEDFHPTLLIFDYADLMISDNYRLEYRHQLDDIWGGIKGLGQKRGCGTMSASQADKKTYEKDIGRGNVSEDKRKMSHVDLAIAINCNDEERKKGIFRLSKLFTRDDSEESWKEAVVVGNLSIGRPYLDCFIREKQGE